MKLGDELPEDKRRVLKDLVRRYPDVFTDMPGETDVIQHQIRLSDDTPIRCKPYPLPYAMREELRNEVDTMLEMGVVRPSTSPYASPIVMVKKKDGSNRVCVDFRKLNKITEVDPEPMTTAEDLFRRLSGKKFLSKIDLTKGYWQIPVAPEDVHKTAFVTPDGQYEFTKTGRSFNQLVVPKELRRQVMSVNHESAFSGHLGAKKTEVRILPNFFWPGLRQDVIRFCRSCDVCQRTVKRGSVRKVPLGSMPLIDTPFKRVAVDIVGPIAPPSEAGHRYILTLVDYATRYPEAVPLKKITTEAVAEALLDIYSRVGIPEEVLTDQGTQFMSECMQEVSRLLSIKGLTSTPYHPICNGLVERWNGTLKSMIKRLCQDQPKQWHRLINPVLFAYREVPQESTGFSPFQLLYGRSVRGPGTILKELWTKEVNIPEVKSSYEYVTELRERLEDSLKLAQEELEKSQKRYKRHYDRKAKPRRLEVGDRVLILLPTDSNKLLMQWRGPYTVESRVGANDYRVKMGSKTKTYHVNMLKKYISREPEGNVVTVDDTDGATVAVAGVIHQDVDPELGEVPDLEGYRQREGVVT